MLYLKPCPFYGKHPKVDIWSPADGKHRDYARGVWIATARSDAAQMRASSLVSKELAIASLEKKWNTRAETTADRLLRHILAENPVLKLPQGLPGGELDLIKELRK